MAHGGRVAGCACRHARRACCACRNRIRGDPPQQFPAGTNPSFHTALRAAIGAKTAARAATNLDASSATMTITIFTRWSTATACLAIPARTGSARPAQTIARRAQSEAGNPPSGGSGAANVAAARLLPCLRIQIFAISWSLAADPVQPLHEGVLNMRCCATASVWLAAHSSKTVCIATTRPMPASNVPGAKIIGQRHSAPPSGWWRFIACLGGGGKCAAHLLKHAGAPLCSPHGHPLQAYAFVDGACVPCADDHCQNCVSAARAAMGGAPRLDWPPWCRAAVPACPAADWQS